MAFSGSQKTSYTTVGIPGQVPSFSAKTSAGVAVIRTVSLLGQRHATISLVGQRHATISLTGQRNATISLEGQKS